MSRYLTLLLCTLTLVVGCSRDPERSSAATPTAPSAVAPGSLLGPTSVAPGGISGKFDVSFPGRDQSFDFRNQLETKYRTGLGRSLAPTFVDREGEVVWTQEYMRYRVNGCDHGSAIAVSVMMTAVPTVPAAAQSGPRLEYGTPDGFYRLASDAPVHSTHSTAMSGSASSHSAGHLRIRLGCPNPEAIGAKLLGNGAIEIYGITFTYVAMQP